MFRVPLILLISSICLFNFSYAQNLNQINEISLKERDRGWPRFYRETAHGQYGNFNIATLVDIVDTSVAAKNCGSYINEGYLDLFLENDLELFSIPSRTLDFVGYLNLFRDDENHVLVASLENRADNRIADMISNRKSAYTFRACMWLLPAKIGKNIERLRTTKELVQKTNNRSFLLPTKYFVNSTQPIKITSRLDLGCFNYFCSNFIDSNETSIIRNNDGEIVWRIFKLNVGKAKEVEEEEFSSKKDIFLNVYYGNSTYEKSHISIHWNALPNGETKRLLPDPIVIELK